MEKERDRTPGGTRAWLPALAMPLLLPFAVASLVIIYVLLRYRRAPAGLSVTTEEVLGCGTGVKTMSDVMERIKAIPCRPVMSRFLATAVYVLVECVPMLLNAGRMTAGFVYPYPEAFEPVIIESQDGTPVCGLLALQPGHRPRPALIFVHGLYGSKNLYSILELSLRAYYRWGFHVLALDLRNFGDSGRLSEAPTSWGYRESDDVLAAAGYLESLDQVSTVGACGVSLGAGSVLLAACRSRLDGPLAGGVIAQNGPAEAGRVIEHVSTMSGTAEALVIRLFFRIMLLLKTTLSGPRPFRDLRKYTREVSSQYYEVTEQELYRKASPVNSAAGIEVPCLIMHAEDDCIVPVVEAEELAAAAKDNPMVGSIVLPRGGHAFYQAVYRKWFYRTVETFFRYWGEWGVEPDTSVADIISDSMYENPDN